ncbi:MAG: uncharacterized protein A8A55_3573, partial [Amphiamblys sp. WSBS2006]
DPKYNEKVGGKFNMERVSMALSSLQTKVTQRENDELAKERGFQDFFAIFLREIIPPDAALEQYISLTPYEVDMWVNNGIGTQKNISSFIEMKTNEEDLYYALLQACLYAYKYCIIKKKTRLFVKIAAVSLPGYRAQIGEMFIELNPETLDVV